MRDGDGGERDGSIAPPAPHVVADVDLDTPNCPDCLLRMELEESVTGKPYWACAQCGLVSLA